MEKRSYSSTKASSEAEESKRKRRKREKTTQKVASTLEALTECLHCWKDDRETCFSWRRINFDAIFMQKCTYMPHIDSFL